MLFSNVVDETLAGNILEFSVKRTRGSVSVITTFYVEFDIYGTLL